MGVRLRERLPLAVLLAAFAGCGAPESREDQEQRLWREQDAAIQEAREREAGSSVPRLGASVGGGESPSRIKRDLLDRYGATLTPFQRSKLLASPIASREEGEAMCRRWAEENRRWEAGSDTNTGTGTGKRD